MMGNEETKKQYFYMEQCREWTQEFEAEHGAPPTFCVVNFGCQMNARDSEKLTGILTEIGFSGMEDETADFVIYNTCTVRENANNKIYGRLGALSNMKKKNPHKMIALCGCMMQEPHVVEKLRESYSFINLIFGTHNLYKFAEMLYGVLRDPEDMRVEVWQDTDQIVENLPSRRKFFYKSGVNITFGCDNFCTYCIVPYVRGRERSRAPEDILDEIRSLVADGVIEVMLLGQNVNSYGKNLDQDIDFARLLAQVDQIEGLQRIRFMTSHPKDLSEDLIAVMRDSKKICRHMHLPLQSGSDRILAAMNRHYTKERYLYLVDKLRENIPDIAITTDIIVGFPGETEEDFLETMDVVERSRFDSAFTFLYSRRTGTPAAKLPIGASEEEIKARFDRLLHRVQEIASEQAAKYTHQVVPVLAEQVNLQDASLLTGRMSNNSTVHFKADSALIGSIVNVRLDQCKGFYYIGEAVE